MTTIKAKLHSDAFMLMIYGQVPVGPYTRQGWFHRWIWNSRDGAVPRIVTIGDLELVRQSWELDHYAPRHRPEPGDWIIRDMSRETFEWNLRLDRKKGVERREREWRPGIPELYQVRSRREWP